MISVLMSVYNETLEEIKQSLDSVLMQSYRDFEVIVVVDQPSYSAGIDLLREYADRDPRVHVLINSQNVGLAVSMNRAAEHASGEYLLRMDADDVCYPDRFRLQYDEISGGSYDLICGNYDFIDEAGNLLPQRPTLYSDRQLKALLPYRNVIHHPTVIMTAKIFREVGGYRNYPCAQDYDLWLRMVCLGAKMHMMPEKMIQYRVREASTTVKKRYKQACTGDYIRALYRQKNRMSGYSYEAYLAYLEKRDVNEPSANADFVENFHRYLRAKQNIKKCRLIRGGIELIKVLLCSKHYRPRILRNFKILVITKLKK